MAALLNSIKAEIKIILKGKEMSKAIPVVQKYMTYVPKSIGFDRPLSQAIELMREMQIRHLPVQMQVN
jgi:CBS domain-containing protein